MFLLSTSRQIRILLVVDPAVKYSNTVVVDPAGVSDHLPARFCSNPYVSLPVIILHRLLEAAGSDRARIQTTRR